MAMKCRKCGEPIAGTPKFCVACGAPVPDIPATLESKAFTPPVPRNRHPTTEPPVTKASMPAPEPTSAPSRPSDYGPPPPPPLGYAPAPPGGSPPIQSPYGPPFVPGARVLVQWADGNRYPGIVQQVLPGQCLIVFPDGQQRWVEYLYLTLAR